MDSIVNQRTKYKFLVVVINDGSPDGSREKLCRYEGLDNVVIIDQENRGLSGARNTGLKHIKAKYVTFVDSDDRMMPGAIEAMMKEAMDQDADIVEGSYKTFYNGEEHEGSRHEYAVTDQWIGKLFGYPWGKVIRSTKFEHICFPEGYWFEDTLFCFILYSMCTKMVTIPDDVYLYRINPKGISSTSVGNPKVVDKWAKLCAYTSGRRIQELIKKSDSASTEQKAYLKENLTKLTGGDNDNYVVKRYEGEQNLMAMKHKVGSLSRVDRIVFVNQWLHSKDVCYEGLNDRWRKLYILSHVLGKFGVGLVIDRIGFDA